MADFSMNANLLERALCKKCCEFTKQDLLNYCHDHNVEFVNFHYCGWEGKLKTLNFVINSKEHLDNILSAGERVDGSSLFPFIEAGRSDLYVIPKYRTAFINPFSEVPSLDLLCSFYDRDGKPYYNSPEYILRKAHKAFKETTGMEMYTMGELEYYVISDNEGLYSVPDQNGYHESAPFNKFTDYRTEAMRLIAKVGGKIKYGHSEVGNFEQDGVNYEQNEIEFLPVNIEEAADQLVLAKWIMRQLAYQWGVTITFAPKITAGKAGNGLHVHCQFIKDGHSMMVHEGQLSDECRKAIAGFMLAGTSLPAFGNPNPLSYLRLVPHQEAPTSLCWSISNRSALVRVPLGWTGNGNMSADCNPLEPKEDNDFSSKQTFEWRASDGCADIYLLMAALCAAARHGFEVSDALDVAANTSVELGVKIHDKNNNALASALEQLPDSCVAAAQELEKDRLIYTSKSVFSDNIVDYMLKYLRSFDDANLRASLKGNNAQTMALVNSNIHVG
jgi:glutamine synthetase